MRFYIDAHLPSSLKDVFAKLGHEAIHTTDLIEGNETQDQEIISLAGNDGVVISKDEDFYQSYLLYGKPPKFVYVKVGNMRLKALKELFKRVAPKLAEHLQQYDLLELHADKIIVID